MLTHRLSAAMFAILGVCAWRVADAQTLTTLYTFNGGSDGANPYAGLTYRGGVLYGTTENGGKTNNGAVFSVNATTGAEKVLYRFQGGTDGATPYAAVTYFNGSLYGTTRLGGTLGWGTLFQVGAKRGGERFVYSFTSQPDGAYPHAGLLYQGGLLYGTTVSGGGESSNAGTVFAFNPMTDTESVVYSFATEPDGTSPYSGLIFAGGTLYGTTDAGGANAGTVFAVNPTNGAEAVVYRFTGTPDGNAPHGTLVYHGSLNYGTTAYGGGAGYGTVFSLDPTTGTETVLHSFSGAKDGGHPFGGLVYLSGYLYGTTDNPGTIFKINATTGAETVLHSFSGGADGMLPYAGLIYVGGAFYGTTSSGGTLPGSKQGAGTVFKFTPN